MRGHAPLPARFFNYQSQPATFLVQPPTSNHSETPDSMSWTIIWGKSEAKIVASLQATWCYCLRMLQSSPGHRIETYRRFTQPKHHNHYRLYHDLWSKCCRHVSSQCGYERHSRPECPPFWILSRSRKDPYSPHRGNFCRPEEEGRKNCFW